MLAAMNPWLLAAIAFATGLAIGAVTVWYISHRGREGGENARRLRRELDSYRQDVRDHFGETAELVHTLDRTYRSVYDHLEKGAVKLVGRDVARPLVREGRNEAERLEPATDATPTPLLETTEADEEVRDT
jgi:uncharacterized membrane-anchored protein YhcB (DUF1043 family)